MAKPKSKLASMKGLSKNQLDPVAGGVGSGVNPKDQKDEMEGAMQDMAFAAEEDSYAEAEAEGSVIGVAAVTTSGLGLGDDQEAEDNTEQDATAGLGAAPGLGVQPTAPGLGIQAAPVSEAQRIVDAVNDQGEDDLEDIDVVDDTESRGYEVSQAIGGQVREQVSTVLDTVLVGAFKGVDDAESLGSGTEAVTKQAMAIFDATLASSVSDALSDELLGSTALDEGTADYVLTAYISSGVMTDLSTRLSEEVSEVLSGLPDDVSDAEIMQSVSAAINGTLRDVVSFNAMTAAVHTASQIAAMFPASEGTQPGSEERQAVYDELELDSKQVKMLERYEDKYVDHLEMPKTDFSHTPMTMTVATLVNNEMNDSVNQAVSKAIDHIMGDMGSDDSLEGIYDFLRDKGAGKIVDAVNGLVAKAVSEEMADEDELVMEFPLDEVVERMAGQLSAHLGNALGSGQGELKETKHGSAANGFKHALENVVEFIEKDSFFEGIKSDVKDIVNALSEEVAQEEHEEMVADLVKMVGELNALDVATDQVVESQAAGALDEPLQGVAGDAASAVSVALNEALEDMLVDADPYFKGALSQFATNKVVAHISDSISQSVAGHLDAENFAALRGLDPDGAALIEKMCSEVKENLGDMVSQFKNNFDSEIKDIDTSEPRVVADAVADAFESALESEIAGKIAAVEVEIDQALADAEARAEARSDTTEAAVGLSSYAASTSIKEHGLPVIEAALEKVLPGADPLLAAVIATRAAASTGTVIENVLTEVFHGLEDTMDGETVRLTSEAVMTRVMSELGRDLGKLECAGIVDGAAGLSSEAEKISYISAEFEKVIGGIARDAIAGEDGEKRLAKIVRNCQEGEDAAKAQLFLEEQVSWRRFETSLANPADSAAALTTFGKIAIPTYYPPSEVVEPSEAEGATYGFNTVSGDNRPEVSVGGETGASAGTVASGTMAAASVSASVGHTMTQRAGDWTQTIKTGAMVAAHAFAGNGAVGAGVAFMAGMDIETDFGGGEKIISRYAVEAGASAGLGLDDGTVKAVGEAGVKVFTSVRGESNTDIGPLGNVDANAEFEAGVEATVEASVGIGAENKFKVEPKVGYYASATAEFGYNNNYISPSWEQSVVAPGSAGVDFDFEAGYKDGVLTLGGATEVSVLLCGVGLGFKAEINLFGNDTTVGSPKEITAALNALKDHVVDYDDDMTEAMLADMKEDGAAIQQDLLETRKTVVGIGKDIADFIEDEETNRPVIQQKLDDKSREASKLALEVESLQAEVEARAADPESAAKADADRPEDEKTPEELLLEREEELAVARAEKATYKDLLIGKGMAAYEGWKTFYELDKGYAEDLRGDAYSLKIGSGARELADEIGRLEANEKVWDKFTDAEKENARKEHDTYHAMVAKVNDMFAEFDKPGGNPDYDAYNAARAEMKAYGDSHPNINIVLTHMDAEANLEDKKAEYQEVAPHSYSNMSAALVNQVYHARDTLSDHQEKQVDALFEVEALEMISDNFMSLGTQGIQPTIDAFQQEWQGLANELATLGWSPTEDMLKNYDPDLVFADGVEIASPEEILAQANELEPPNMDDYVPSEKTEEEKKAKEVTPDRFVDAHVLEVNERIRNNPVLKQFFAMKERLEAFNDYLNENAGSNYTQVAGDLQEAKDAYAQESAIVEQAESHFSDTIENLRAEHPMLQSQYKLDCCRENIANLEAALKEDRPEGEKSGLQAQLMGYKLFLAKNEGRLMQDAEEMREAHKEHDEDLQELYQKHQHLSTVIHNDGLFGWLI
jgi:hypothetical protein